MLGCLNPNLVQIRTDITWVQNVLKCNPTVRFVHIVPNFG